MFTEFRGAVFDELHDKLASAPIWGQIPDDVNEVPCVVVGRPGGQESTGPAIVWDLTLPVHVIGRRTDAGGSEFELLTLLDDVMLALGGTRGTHDVRPIRMAPELVPIAGLDWPGYVITVEEPAATC